MTKIACAAFVLSPFAISSCATGTTRPGIGGNGDGGEAGEWGAQSSSSSSSSGSGGGSGGGNGGSSSASSSSSSAASSSSSSSSSGGGGGAASFVVLRVGDGISALTGTATRVYIEHLQTDGSPTPGKTTIELPGFASGTNWPLTLSGSASAEGNLSLSSNGKYVVLAGYGADAGTPVVNTTDANVYPRVVGRIDAQGVVNTTTSLGTAFSTSSVRGATSTDGISIWVSGNGTASLGGVHHTTLGASGTTQILAAPSNARFVNVVSNQLYGTSGAGTFVNVFTIGTGVPTSSGQTATPLPGMPTTTGPSPYAFALVDRLPAVAGVDTLYVADDRAILNGGGIQRWVYDGFSWLHETTFGDGTSGVRGLAAKIEGTGVRIIATTSESPTNRILSVFDEPGFSPIIVPIATSPVNTLYRGVAFAPQ
ncbi:MAG: hypothetical protein IPM54_45045 [Polyangiaceae bacterium]|nr:hypothetical protein [Polyangiaceae bacterium]